MANKASEKASRLHDILDESRAAAEARASAAQERAAAADEKASSLEQSILLLQQNILLLQQQVKGAEEAEEVFVREVEDGRKREEALSARVTALERMGEEAQTLVQRAREESEAAERLKVQVSSLE